MTAGVSLRDDLYGDRFRAGVVARSGRAVDLGRDEVDTGGRRLAFGQTGAADLVRADLRNRGADDSGKRRGAAGCVLSCDAALLVGVSPERDIHLITEIGLERTVSHISGDAYDLAKRRIRHRRLRAQSKGLAYGAHVGPMATHHRLVDHHDR